MAEIQFTAVSGAGCFGAPTTKLSSTTPAGAANASARSTPVSTFYQLQFDFSPGGSSHPAKPIHIPAWRQTRRSQDGEQILVWGNQRGLELYSWSGERLHHWQPETGVITAAAWTGLPDSPLAYSLCTTREPELKDCYIHIGRYPWAKPEPGTSPAAPNPAPLAYPGVAPSRIDSAGNGRLVTSNDSFSLEHLHIFDFGLAGPAARNVTTFRPETPDEAVAPSSLPLPLH